MDFSPSRRRLPLILELTPLIDVVFLLLIFFMVSTTFVNEPAGLQVELPRSENRELIPEGSDVSLVLLADGQIELEGEAVPLEELKASLARIARDEPSTVVVLRADTKLEHGRVVQVMDLVRTLGLTHFAIATDAAGSTP
ncbi:MAG: biopolymer transporter ExbD [Deltaproteobacteria bacterium]|nr:biopolymer transporter ExbD [Deltaproteobacteria bacterium]